MKSCFRRAEDLETSRLGVWVEICVCMNSVIISGGLKQPGGAGVHALRSRLHNFPQYTSGPLQLHPIHALNPSTCRPEPNTAHNLRNPPLVRRGIGSAALRATMAPGHSPNLYV